MIMSEDKLIHTNIKLIGGALVPFEPTRNAVIVEIDNNGVIVSLECKDKNLQWALDRLAREILGFVSYPPMRHSDQITGDI